MSNTAVAIEKFTPAPWVSEYDDNGFFYVGADGMPSPYIVATGGEGAADEANAKLIAAAPDMYKVLDRFSKAVFPNLTDNGESLVKLYQELARLVIKKATE